MISLLFHSFRMPVKYQHRILFWGILGAVVFRRIMRGGGAHLAHRFSWIFYVFGGYLAYRGVKLLRHDDHDEVDHDNSLAVRIGVRSYASAHIPAARSPGSRSRGDRGPAAAH